MKSSFQSKGIEAYLEEIARAGEDIDKVAAEVLTEARGDADAALHANLRKTSETWTGAADKTLFSTDVQQDGNFIYFELGADISKDPAAIYKEFGRPRQAAEPFFRPTFTKLRGNVKKMLKEVFDQMGVRT